MTEEQEKTKIFHLLLTHQMFEKARAGAAQTTSPKAYLVCHMKRRDSCLGPCFILWLPGCIRRKFNRKRRSQAWYSATGCSYPKWQLNQLCHNVCSAMLISSSHFSLSVTVFQPSWEVGGRELESELRGHLVTEKFCLWGWSCTPLIQCCWPGLSSRLSLLR